MQNFSKAIYFAVSCQEELLNLIRQCFEHRIEEAEAIITATREYITWIDRNIIDSDSSGQGVYTSGLNKHGYNALHLAAIQEDPETLSYFIQQGLNPECADKNGCTALTHALEALYKDRKKPQEVHDNIMTLIKAGASVNTCHSIGVPLLTYAVLKNDLKTVKYFLENNANIDAQDLQENSALMCAAGHGFTDIFYYLLEKQAKTHLLNLKKYNLLMCAVIGRDEKIFKTVLYLNGLNIRTWPIDTKIELSHYPERIGIMTIRLLSSCQDAMVQENEC